MNNGRELISLNDYDSASGKIKQLGAMMTAVTGEGFEHFHTMSADQQHCYLWAVAEQVHAIREAVCKGKEASRA